MNKRDLIKALFKNPTIKALYESGHFNATDINRAILTEASANTNLEYSTEKIQSNLQDFIELVKNYTPKFELRYLREYRDLLRKVDTNDFQDENFLTYLSKIANSGSIPQGVIKAYQKNNMPQELLEQTPWKEILQPHMKYIKKYQLAKRFLDFVITNFETMNFDKNQESIIDKIVQQVEKYPQHGKRQTNFVIQLFADKFKKTPEQEAFISLYSDHIKVEKNMGTSTFFSEFNELFEKAVKYAKAGSDGQPNIDELLKLRDEFDQMNIEDQEFITSGLTDENMNSTFKQNITIFRKAITVKYLKDSLDINNIQEISKEFMKGPLSEMRGGSKHLDTYLNYTLQNEFKEGLKNFIQNSSESSGDETASDKNYSKEQKKEYMSLAKLIVSTNTLINKPEFVEKQENFLKSLSPEDFLKELVSAYLQSSNQTDQTNRVNELIDEYAKDESIKPLQQQITKLKASLDKIQGDSPTPSGEPSTTSVNEYVDGLANKFDEKATKTALSKLTQWSYENGNSDAKNMSILKAFIAYAAQNKEPVNESEQEAQREVFLDASVKKFLQELESNEVDEDLLTLARSILEKAATNKGFQEIFEDLKDNMNLPASSPEEESIQKKRQQLLQRASSALALLNIENSELLKNDVFMIFMGSVLEKEGVIREAEEQLESYVEKYLPQLENEETREEFYITQEEVGDLKTFLENNKDNVDKIITAAIKATKDNKDPSMDDESPPELAELQENWTEVLMTFFGKNPKKSSFMKRLLLRSQAKMLYGVMDVLEQISDPEQMSAYTDMNQGDEREAQAEKSDTDNSTPAQPANSETGAEENPTDKQTRTDESLREALRDMIPSVRTGTGMNLNNSEPNKSDDTKEEDPQTEPKQTQPEPQAQQDKVELPAKTRRIIKQDLQSMVDLLRQLKLAIKDYSMYATRKSADPRFDGSKLKANMDELLTQVQDDIYDLHSNLKPADIAPETDDENIEEALNGIMLEEDDPERQAKIQLVRETYDNAKREYIYVLMPSMEKPNWTKSQASAKKILDILKEEKFISLFPTGMKTAGGKVMTVGKAYESMTAVIQEFVETVRDIVLISKEKYIAKTSLTQAKNDLKKISIEIAELFRVPSKFSTEEIKQAKEEESTKPENQAITPEPDNKLEQKEGDNTADAGTTVPSAGGDDLEKFEEVKKFIEKSKEELKPVNKQYKKYRPAIEFFDAWKEIVKLMDKEPTEVVDRNMTAMSQKQTPPDEKFSSLYNKIINIFPYHERIVKKTDLSENGVKRKPLMNDFFLELQKNPDLIDDVELFSENLLDEYKQILENKENLTLHQMMDLHYLKSLDKDDSAEQDDDIDLPDYSLFVNSNAYLVNRNLAEKLKDLEPFEELNKKYGLAHFFYIAAIDKEYRGTPQKPKNYTTDNRYKEIHKKFAANGKYKDFERFALSIHLAKEELTRGSFEETAQLKKDLENVPTDPILNLTDEQVKSISDRIKEVKPKKPGFGRKTSFDKTKKESLERSLKPIIEAMLKKHYNH